MSDHEARLLAAIIPNRRDLLDSALRSLMPEHFTDPVYRNLYVILDRYAHITGAVINEIDLAELLERNSADAGKILRYREVYQALEAKHVDESEFRWSIAQLRELAAERATHSVLTESMTILTRGMEQQGGEELKGHQDARMHLLSRFADIERNLSMQDAPEGDIRTEGEDLLAEYAAKKQAHALGQNTGVLFGIPALDAKVGGIQRGELDLIAGYSASGKSSMAAGLAWHACTQQGLNVYFATTETLRPQIRRKIVSRHSRLGGFDIPDGLNTRDLRDGTLNDHLESKYQDVVHDLTSNELYGKLHIAQVPRGSTIGMLEARLIRYQRQVSIDLVVVDMLPLFKPERKRNSSREELNDILKETKQIATTFNDGLGVPIISPWQINRKGFGEAGTSGAYSTEHLAETSEATNSGDIIISIFAIDSTERYNDISVQVLKNRDGETSAPLSMRIDYATSYITERSHNAAVDSADPFASLDEDGFGILA